jgi:hypothetical protein
MSYRSSLTVVECAASMKALDVGKAQRLLEKADCYAESCFLDEMRKAADDLIDDSDPNEEVPVPKDRCWFSGNHVSEESLALVAPLIVGRLSGYFVGEDGGLHGGFVIEDGKLTGRSVMVVLTP